MKCVIFPAFSKVQDIKNTFRYNSVYVSWTLWVNTSISMSAAFSLGDTRKNILGGNFVFFLKNWVTSTVSYFYFISPSFSLITLFLFFSSNVSYPPYSVSCQHINSSGEPFFCTFNGGTLAARCQGLRKNPSQVPDPSTVLNHPPRMYNHWLTLPPVYDSSSSHQTITFALPSTLFLGNVFSFPPPLLPPP